MAVLFLPVDGDPVPPALRGFARAHHELVGTNVPTVRAPRAAVRALRGA
jgi:hypothetical protein